MRLWRGGRAVSLRGLVVALGVPAAFVTTALAFGSVVPAAQAVTAEDAVVVSLPEKYMPSKYSVRRTAVLDFGRLVHRGYTVKTTAPVAFITIDDGVNKDRRALDYVRQMRLPITSFVSAWTIKNEADFFVGISQFGSIQNHSATHANLMKASTDLDHEICYSQRMLKSTFGEKPWMMRPPYGAGMNNPTVLRKAYNCGIRDMVLWDAVVHHGKVTSTGSLRPGSIVLLHFGPNLTRDLKAAVAAIHKAGLVPANLADYLPDSR